MAFDECSHPLWTDVAYAITLSIDRVNLRVSEIIAYTLNVADKHTAPADMKREVTEGLWKIVFCRDIAVVIIMLHELSL